MLVVYLMLLFCFCSQKTAYEMRISDWSSDVCSSDLCRAFEREFAAWSESNHAIAVANGTVALDLALQGLGVGSANGGSADDEVIVTPRTFIASISCVANAGAKPVRSEEHTSELQSLMRISYAVFCLKKKTKQHVSRP